MQQEIAKNFHQVAVNKWQDNTIRFIKKIILDNFKGAKNSFLTKDVKEINTYIVRFLKSVYQLQMNHLFEKYERELKNYLEFLLRFANLSADFQSKQPYLDYGLDQFHVRMSDKNLILATVQIDIIQASKDNSQSMTNADLMKKNSNPFKNAMRRLRPMHAD